MKKPSKNKSLDAEIERVYRESCHGIEIDIFDVSRVFDVARQAHTEGRDMRSAIVAFVQTIRKN